MKLDFSLFQLVISEQFDRMKEHGLFRVDISKDLLWDTYLSSFPEGTNPIFRERTEHDCQCCKQFIRAVGGMVAIIDGKIVSIWDVTIDGGYQVVADALSKVVKSRSIANIFLHIEKKVGTEKNNQRLDSGEILTWNHFYVVLPDALVMKGKDIGPKLSDSRSTKDVFERSLKELSVDALDTVLELIDQKSLYRGEEHRFAVNAFRNQKVAYEKLSDEEKTVFVWTKLGLPPSVTRFRNTVIGTLVSDISGGTELDAAVRMFESKVAPMNYKRPTAVITKSMIDSARKKVEELGFTSALSRRYARIEDITINNIRFADREAKKRMSADVFDELSSQAAVKVQSLDKVEEVSIDTFIDTILPKATTVEVMFENKHAGNLVSLVAPTDPESKGMFKWGNNYSWAYAGELADSIKERVKNAGGDVTGDLRFSIQWNDEDVHNCSDYDAHCMMPDRFKIYYGNRKHARSGGELDVDITGPKTGVPAVENITFPSRDKMPIGKYELLVHNYAKRDGDTGFRAEIEFDGKIYSFNYPKTLRYGEKVKVAEVELTPNLDFVIKPVLDSSHHSKEIWNIQTQQFHRVSMVMNSPNHWDDKATGNKHYFFMIDGCLNEGKARGFFNEFLTDVLREHRKVFEVLGSKMKTEESDNQLSGLGFSSTQRNSVFVRVGGSFSRIIKVTF